jgi:hypothetical protein
MASILMKLHKHSVSQRLVDVFRTPKHAERISGFVVGVGSKWVLISRIADGGCFDGHTALRVADISRISKSRTFETDYAREQPEWPPVLPFHIDLSSTSGVIRTIAAKAPLIGIEKEHERRACWIGTLDEISHRMVFLNEVRPDASWHPEPLGYRLKAVTTVQAGDRYMVALAGVALRPTS